MLINDIFLHTFTFHSLPSVIKIEQFKTDNVSLLITLLTDIFLHKFTLLYLPSVIKIEQFKTDNVSLLIKLKRKTMNIKTQHDDFIETQSDDFYNRYKEKDPVEIHCPRF